LTSEGIPAQVAVFACMFQYCGYIHINLSTPLTFVNHRPDTIYISEISLPATTDLVLQCMDMLMYTKWWCQCCVCSSVKTWLEVWSSSPCTGLKWTHL